MQEGAVSRRGRADTFEVDGVAERLAAYEVVAHVEEVDEPDVESELLERAVRLLLIMPRPPRRETVESLLSPNDPERGRRAVDALIESAYAAEDEAGRIRRI
jgi:hypothetical protein